MALGSVGSEDCCREKMKGILFSNGPGYDGDVGDEMECDDDVEG